MKRRVAEKRILNVSSDKWKDWPWLNESVYTRKEWNGPAAIEESEAKRRRVSRRLVPKRYP